MISVTFVDIIKFATLKKARLLKLDGTKHK